VRLLFWAGFFLAGVWLQRLLPGVDALAPGLLLSLQREPWPVAAAVAVVLIVVQEGAGSLDFGAGLLIYGLLVCGYAAGRSVFDARSAAFSALLGVGHALATALAARLLAGLQQFTFDMADLPVRLAVQAGLFVVVWQVVDRLHPQNQGETGAQR